VTPRHMLESDHKNFFTRWSSVAAGRFTRASEVLLHTRHRASQGRTPLFYNLFAVAWSRIRRSGDSGLATAEAGYGERLSCLPPPPPPLPAPAATAGTGR